MPIFARILELPLTKCKVAARQPIKNSEEKFEKTARDKKRSNTVMRMTMGQRAYPSESR